VASNFNINIGTKYNVQVFTWFLVLKVKFETKYVWVKYG